MTKKKLVATLREIAASPPQRHTLDPLSGHVSLCTHELEAFVAPRRWRKAEAAVRAAAPELEGEDYAKALAEEFARLREIEQREGPLFPLIAAPLLDKNRDEPPLSEEEAAFFISRTIKARALLFRQNIEALIAALGKGK